MSAGPSRLRFYPLGVQAHICGVGERKCQLLLPLPSRLKSPLQTPRSTPRKQNLGSDRNNLLRRTTSIDNASNTTRQTFDNCNSIAYNQVDDKWTMIKNIGSYKTSVAMLSTGIRSYAGTQAPASATSALTVSVRTGGRSLVSLVAARPRAIMKA